MLFEQLELLDMGTPKPTTPTPRPKPAAPIVRPDHAKSAESATRTASTAPAAAPNPQRGKLSAAQALARQLMATHNVADWGFRFNHRKRTLGLCVYSGRRIELSAHFVLGNDEPAIRDTILHEIAHALAGVRAGHGPKWKAIARKIRAKPERLDRESVMPDGRWRAVCPACGKKFSRHRRPGRGRKYACRACGPKKGAIQFYLMIDGMQS